MSRSTKSARSSAKISTSDTSDNTGSRKSVARTQKTHERDSGFESSVSCNESANSCRSIPSFDSLLESENLGKPKPSTSQSTHRKRQPLFRGTGSDFDASNKGSTDSRSTSSRRTASSASSQTPSRPSSAVKRDKSSRSYSGNSRETTVKVDPVRDKYESTSRREADKETMLYTSKGVSKPGKTNSKSFDTDKNSQRHSKDGTRSDFEESAKYSKFEKTKNDTYDLYSPQGQHSENDKSIKQSSRYQRESSKHIEKDRVEKTSRHDAVSKVSDKKTTGVKGQEMKGNGSELAMADGIRVYKDTPQNRTLDRVNKPVGSAVFHKSTGTVTQEKYVYSPLNVELGRAGEYRGSRPFKRSAFTSKIFDFVQKMERNEKIDVRRDDSTESAMEHAVCKFNRNKQEKAYQESHSSSIPSTLCDILAQYSGATIPHQELDLQLKIGQGGFGVVYFAKWKGSVVAVKTLRRDRASEKYATKTAEEIIKCWKLNHENIVHFIGASIRTDKLCLVMEYMPMSLYDALHLNKVQHTEKQILKIIQGVCAGLCYMHMVKHMAHCDIKPHNVLLDYLSGIPCRAKLTDFGLSMSTEGMQTVRHVGTPRYSAPEVLCGRSLRGKDMMKSDIYSLALLLFEVIYKAEPLHHLSRSELREKVGKLGMTPEIPRDINVQPGLQEIIVRAWNRKADDRPTVQQMRDAFKVQKLYLTK